MKYMILALSALLGACSSFSGSALRCGVDEGSSFVELVNFPQDMSSQSRNFKDLCAFSYDNEQPIIKMVQPEEN